MKKFVSKLIIITFLLILPATLVGCSLFDFGFGNPPNGANPQKIELVGSMWLFAGDFNIEDYSVIVTMDDASTKTFQLSDRELSVLGAEDFNTVGQHQLTVTYKTLRYSFTLIVLSINDIQSINLSGETTFTVGSFNINNYSVNFITKDNYLYTVPLSSKYISQADLNKLNIAGTHTITISCHTLSTNITFTINELFTLKSIALVGETSINLGDFDINNYYIKATMSDNTTQNILLTTENISQADIDKLNTIGTHQVIINYNSLTIEVIFVVTQQINDAVTLTFNVDGKNLSCDVERGTILTEELANTLYQSEKLGMVGYIVNDWYTNISLENEFTFNNAINSSTTLYGESEYFVNTLLTAKSAKKFNDALLSKTLTISSFDELSSYFLYLQLFVVSAEQAPVIELEYLSSPTTEQISNEFNKAIENVSDNANFSVGATYGWTSNKVYVISTLLEEMGSRTLDSTGTLYDQKKNILVKEFDETREEDFDDFNIDNVAFEVEVSYSEQLYYAMQLGFNPVCEQDSAASDVYNKAKNVLREICNDQMTNTEKVYAIYNWIIENVQYDNFALEKYENNEFTVEDYARLYDSWSVEGVFNQHKAVCEGFAKTFLILAKLENIPCVYITGTDSTGNGHAWNKVYVNGNWFVIDSTHGNLLEGTNKEECYNYTQFLITDTYKATTGCNANVYTDLVCNTIFDFYDFIDFEYNENMFDLNIDSYEVNTLINLIKSRTEISFTIEITCGNTVNLNNDILSNLNSNYTMGLIEKTTTTGAKSYIIFFTKK